MNNEIDAAIADEIRRAQSIGITTHIRPDGDAIGSLLGMGLALIEQGKHVDLVSKDGIPASLRFIPGSELVHNVQKGPVDLTIALDCSDLIRTGRTIEHENEAPDINIDHHATNVMFGKHNLIDVTAVSTTEILALHMPSWGLTLNKNIADCLMTGMITDTIGFRTANMTPRALNVAAGLVDMGADLPGLYNKALVRKTFEALKYWGEGLAKLERADRIVWATVTPDDRKIAGYSGRDDADMINIISTIDGADIFILFNDQGNGHIKVSWRSIPGIDISGLALAYGGGGHPSASGADIEGQLEEICSSVLQMTAQTLMQASNLQ